MYTLLLVAVLNTAFGSLGTALEGVIADDPPIAETHEAYIVLKSYEADVTAYSSRVEETDDTPFLAASGKNVHWGMVASNSHPFGTQIRFPELYPDTVFIVGDRMHSRFNSRLDIWFPEYEAARRFGKQTTRVEVIEANTEPVLSKN